MRNTAFQDRRKAEVKKVTGITVGVAVVFSIMWIAMGSYISVGAKERDFLNLYVGAQMAADGEFARLHDQGLQLEYERRLLPKIPALWPFVRPHFYAALLIPLSWLPFKTAFLAWVGLQTILLLGCWVWAARRFGEGALILGSMYLPTAIGVASGQDCIFLLVAVIAAYCLAEKRRDFLAGAVVALTLAKFHLLLLLPFAMWIAGRRIMLAGWATAAIALLLISLALAGPHGVASYVHMLTDPTLAGLNPAPQKIVSIHSFQWNLFGQPYLPITIALVAAVAALCWIASRRAPLWRWWTAGCLASLLAVPHVYAYDASYLLLGIWLVTANAQTRLSRVFAAMIAPPLVFFVSFVQSEYAVMVAPAAALTALLVAIAREATLTSRLAPTTPLPEGPALPSGEAF
ncbi:MAG: glycosyltransferase family 87 protein [Acidobacteria bacterium]|nr:glycosyltransferase family 87 protein [Acidobacteriota bacterium]